MSSCRHRQFRLQPTDSCGCRAGSCERRSARLTCSTRTAQRTPREEPTSKRSETPSAVSGLYECHPADLRPALVRVEFARGSSTSLPCIHRRPHQRGAVSFRLARAPTARLAAPRGNATQDASEPTYATLHFFDYEYPRLVGSGEVAELAPHAHLATVRFTTPDWLRRVARLFSCGAFSSPGRVGPSIRSRAARPNL